MTPIRELFIKGVGREPTPKELEAYIKIIVFPTKSSILQTQRIKNLKEEILKENERRGNKISF